MAPRSYRSYLLRLVWTSGEGEDVWRIVLEDPVTAERYRFPDLDTLKAFLEAEMREGIRGPKDEAEHP